MDAILAEVWHAGACGWAVCELVLLAPWTRCYFGSPISSATPRSSPRRAGGALSMHDTAQAERDERLIAAIAQGDRDALGELYEIGRAHV